MNTRIQTIRARKAGQKCVIPSSLRAMFERSHVPLRAFARRPVWHYILQHRTTARERNA